MKEKTFRARSNHRPYIPPFPRTKLSRHTSTAAGRESIRYHIAPSEDRGPRWCSRDHVIGQEPAKVVLVVNHHPHSSVRSIHQTIARHPPPTPRSAPAQRQPTQQTTGESVTFFFGGWRPERTPRRIFFAGLRPMIPGLLILDASMEF